MKWAVAHPSLVHKYRYHFASSGLSTFVDCKDDRFMSLIELTSYVFVCICDSLFFQKRQIWWRVRLFHGTSPGAWFCSINGASTSSIPSSINHTKRTHLSHSPASHRYGLVLPFDIFYDWDAFPPCNTVKQGLISNIGTSYDGKQLVRPCSLLLQ